MNWVEIAITLCVIVIVFETVYKIKLHRRLEDIDGFYGVHQAKQGEQTIIGSFESDGHNSLQ
jgi:hypothetical protein